MKYTNLSHCKALQNLPKFGFFVWKYTIWQPCSNSQVDSDPFLRRKSFFPI
jgi:hypothetical protein